MPSVSKIASSRRKVCLEQDLNAERNALCVTKEKCFQDALLMILCGANVDFSYYLKVLFGLNSLCLAFYLAYKGS